MQSADVSFWLYNLLQKEFTSKYKGAMSKLLPWTKPLMHIEDILSKNEWWEALEKDEKEKMDRRLAIEYERLSARDAEHPNKRTLDLLRITEAGKGEYIPRLDGHFYIFVGLSRDYFDAAKNYGDGRVRYFYCMDAEPWERQTESYWEGAVRIDFDALCRLSSKGTVVIISDEAKAELSDRLYKAGIQNCYGFVEYRDKRRRILYGAGVDGALALKEFGSDIVEYFAETTVSKKVFCGKEVISFEGMKGLADRYRIVISSSKNRVLFTEKLRRAGINDFDVFRPRFCPMYSLNGHIIFRSYTELIKEGDIKDGDRVAIVGTDGDIFSLIAEVRFCGGEIIGIVDPNGLYESIMGVPCVLEWNDMTKKYREIDVAVLNLGKEGGDAISGSLIGGNENRHFRVLNMKERLDKNAAETRSRSQQKPLGKWNVIGHSGDYIKAAEWLGAERIGKYICLDSEDEDFRKGNELLTGAEIISFEKFEKEDVHGMVYVIPGGDSRRMEDELCERGILNFYGQHKLKERRTLVLFDDVLIDERTVRFVKNEYGENVRTCTGDGKGEISYEELKANKDNYLVMLVTEPRYADQEFRLKRDGIADYVTFKWGERYPDFWLNGRRIERSFNELLSRKRLSKYKKISIYGITFRIYELVSELKIQYPEADICGIVDPDNMYHEIMGIACIDLNTALRESDCLILLDDYGNSDIRYKLERIENLRPIIIDLYDIMPDEKLSWFPNLRRFKNTHRGERCFIIGNGPSLKIEDLETLHKAGEICFAVNYINLIYGQTAWRPDYYVVAGIEQACMDVFENHLRDIPGTKFITAWYQRNIMFRQDNTFHYFSMQPQFRNYDVPKHNQFSADISKRIHECYTVVYVAFQIAAYMGFSEMYLLGIDNGGKGHFYNEEDYDAEFVSLGLHHSRAYRFERDWEEAEWYSRNHGFRIYNATRGGALETFERVDFDTLF